MPREGMRKTRRDLSRWSLNSSSWPLRPLIFSTGDTGGSETKGPSRVSQCRGEVKAASTYSGKVAVFGVWVQG